MNPNLYTVLEDVDIANIFHELFDKLDKQSIDERTNALYVPINEVKFTELFRGQEYQEDYIQILISENIFSLVVSKKLRFRPWTEKKAKLRFNSQKEILLREYYNREIKNDLWKEAIDTCSFEFEEELKEILLKIPIRIYGKSDIEVIERFTQWVQTAPPRGSAREESARCFWGMSKIFDTKEELCKYFNLRLLPITLLMHAHSDSIQEVLFIENLETFYQVSKTMNNIFNEMLIVYSSGYKASARRVRHKNGSCILFSENCLLSNASKQEVLDWLYLINKKHMKVYFWGDLDYEGIAILDALREQFKNIQLWEQGYLPMTQAVNNNFGHSPNMAGKEKQRKVEVTLKEDDLERSIKELLVQSNTFIDQEYVDISKL